LTWSVVIAGMGRIGCGYDLQRAADAVPMSHCGAVMADPRFTLLAAADPDRERHDAAQSRWPDIRCVTDGAAAIAGMKPDIACIATPGSARLKLAEAAVEAGVKLLFCEKPLAASGEDAEKIAGLCREAGIPLAVNLSRRWEPGCIRTAGMIADGAIGRPRRAIGLYTRGINNNAAHLVDLVHWWLGPTTNYEITGRTVADAPDFRLRTETGVTVDICGMDGSECDYFRLEIFGSEGRILLDDFGEHLSLRKAVPLEADPTLRVLGESNPIPFDPLATMPGAWSNIAGFLGGVTNLRCTSEDGLAAVRVCTGLEAML
jgi:predicted dehydrogenase